MKKCFLGGLFAAVVMVSMLAIIGLVAEEPAAASGSVAGLAHMEAGDIVYIGDIAIALARSADVYEEVPLVLSKLDSGTGGSVPTFIGIRVAYSYTEDYIKSGNDFYSLGVASETRILSVDPVFAHLVEARANSRIPYYDSGDREIFTGRLLPVNYPLSMDYSSVVGDPFHNSPIPAYARGGITALLSGGLGPALHNTTIMY